MNTMNEVFNRYERECVPLLAARTQRQYRYHMKSLREHFGHFVPGSIKPKDVGRYLDVPKGTRHPALPCLHSVYGAKHLHRRLCIDNRNPFNQLRGFAMVKKAKTGTLQPSTLERLLEFIDKRTETDCWPWLGCRLKHGYGVVQWRGKRTTAHRAVYMAVHGPVSADTDVCHSCDNRICCNPSHLWAGSHYENMRDMYEKGRNKPKPKTAEQIARLSAALKRRHAERPYAGKGENSPVAKLTNEAVLAMLDRGASLDDLSRRYGVSKSMVVMIRNGNRWSSVTGIIKAPIKRRVCA